MDETGAQQSSLVFSGIPVMILRILVYNIVDRNYRIYLAWIVFSWAVITSSLHVCIIIIANVKYKRPLIISHL